MPSGVPAAPAVAAPSAPAATAAPLTPRATTTAAATRPNVERRLPTAPMRSCMSPLRCIRWFAARGTAEPFPPASTVFDQPALRSFLSADPQDRRSSGSGRGPTGVGGSRPEGSGGREVGEQELGQLGGRLLGHPVADALEDLEPVRPGHPVGRRLRRRPPE